MERGPMINETICPKCKNVIEYDEYTWAVKCDKCDCDFIVESGVLLDSKFLDKLRGEIFK